jgi:hypothetical protein
LGYVAMDALQAAILDEFACKLVAIDCCVPKADRAAARQALLSERAAKLRRASETMPRARRIEGEVVRQWFRSRKSCRVRHNKKGLPLRRRLSKSCVPSRYARLASPSAG